MSDQSDQERSHFTIASDLGLAGLEAALSSGLKQVDRHSMKVSCLRSTGATAWLNSPPLTAADLRGKVVLVDFWTYTCINWLRTLPYVRAWAEKYQRSGSGGDRRAYAGVPIRARPRQRAPRRQGHAGRLSRSPSTTTMRYGMAFSNHYWPAIYLIDAEGHIRHHQFGEGDYDGLK